MNENIAMKTKRIHSTRISETQSHTELEKKKYSNLLQKCFYRMMFSSFGLTLRILNFLTLFCQLLNISQVSNPLFYITGFVIKGQCLCKPYFSFDNDSLALTTEHIRRLAAGEGRRNTQPSCLLLFLCPLPVLVSFPLGGYFFVVNFFLLPHTRSSNLFQFSVCQQLLNQLRAFSQR